MSNQKKLKAISKDSRGLAGAMFEEIEMLRNGESTPQQARAKASIANTICTISRLEMDFARFVTASRSETAEDMRSLPMA